MTLKVERPRTDTPDAGVIEEARARQRRQRGAAGAVALAGVAIAAMLSLIVGGGGGSHTPTESLSRPDPGWRAGRTPSSPCGGPALQSAPSSSLVSILGVLRRPATAADAGSGVVAAGAVRDVFVRFVRRARVVSGSPYFIYPAVLGGCGTGERAHEGIMELATHVNLGHGVYGGTGGGGYTAAEIEHGQAVGTAGVAGSSTSATLTMIVPDGVAAVTLHYPAGRASGYSAKVSPPFTATSTPVNNLLVMRIPRSGGPEGVRGITMIWRGSSGRILKTFHKL